MKKYFSHYNPVRVTNAQVFVGSIVVYILALIFEPNVAIDLPLKGVIGLIYLSFITAAAVSIWMGLVSRKDVKISTIAMWKFLIEKEYIFSTDALLIRRLTGEAPFSRDFGNDSPPRTASWIGYQIVKKMMSREKVSLNDLIYTLTPKEILSLSAYRP